jgi:hypothetical protein
MKKLLVLLLTSLCSVAFASEFLVAGCKVMNNYGAPLLTLPGETCLFRDNGDFISAGKEGMKYFNSQKKILWEIPGDFHHELDFSLDKNIILAKTQTIKPGTDGKHQMDILMKVSMEGKILAQIDSAEILKQAGIPVMLRDLHYDPSTIKEGPTQEISHFNTLFEIPPYKNSHKNKFLRPGDYVSNNHLQGIFILSSDLKRVVHHYTVPTSRGQSLHDVQVNSDGNFIFFNNDELTSPMNAKSSAVQIMNPQSKKIIFTFGSSYKPLFYSINGGAVQMLGNDHLLISTLFTGTYLYSKKKNAVIHATQLTHIQDSKPIIVLRVKAVELSKFLAVWKVEENEPLKY